MTARLMVEVEDRTPQIVRQDDGFWVLATTITLELHDKSWHGVRHGTALIPLDGGYSFDVGIPLDDVADTTTLDTSPKTITITNDGNMPCDQITLDLLAGSADVTAFSYQCGKANIARLPHTVRYRHRNCASRRGQTNSARCESGPAHGSRCARIVPGVRRRAC
jgi:hypothetical protein